MSRRVPDIELHAAESLDGGFTVQKVPSAVWMTWTCDKASFADLVSKTREAAVLTGSEWP